MYQRSIKKLLCILFTLATSFGLLAMGMSAYAAGVTWDADQTFDSDLTISGGVNVSRSIELTINEGVTVTVNGGINAESKTVTVAGKGTLIVKDSTFKGNLIVNGASVRANGSNGRDGRTPPEKEYLGENGGNGSNGDTAIIGDVTVTAGSLTAIGGNGGNGGNGGEVFDRETGRGIDCISGTGGNGGNGGYAIKGNLTIQAGSATLTAGNGGNGGNCGFVDYLGQSGDGGNGGNGGIGVDGTVTVNGGKVVSTGGDAGKGGLTMKRRYNGRDGYSGTFGRGVLGVIEGVYNATVSWSRDNITWNNASIHYIYSHQYIKASAPTRATGLALDKTSAVMKEHSVIRLEATITPEDTTAKYVKWSVGNRDMVKLYADENCSQEISLDGYNTALTVYVKGTAPGDTTVTATSVDSELLSATCDITVEHIHDFLYAANGDTITATCISNVCPEKQGDVYYVDTLVIAAPNSPVYDGSAFPATLNKTSVGYITKVSDIQYRRKTGESTWSAPTVKAPIEAGTYLASITLKPDDGDPLTASVTYTIEMATIDIDVEGWKGTYDGNEHAITLNVNAPKGTQIAYRTTDSGRYDLTKNPTFTEAGTYTVYYRVTKANYTTVEDSRTVQIDKAPLTRVAVIPLGDLTYTGEEQTQAVRTEADSVNNQPVTFTYSRTQDGPYGEMPTVTNVRDSGTFYYKASAPNHHDYTGSFTVTVQPDKVLEVVTPTPAAVTYDPTRTLKDIALPEGWAWVNDDIVPQAGNTGHTAVLRVDDENYDYSQIEDYNQQTHTVTRTVNLTVNKAEVIPPAILEKPYTGNNQIAEVPESTLYTVTKNKGGIQVGPYDVVLTLTDPKNYRWPDSPDASITLIFRIEHVILPTAGPVTYDPNRTLNDVPLLLNEAYDEKSWDWHWVDTSIVPVVNNTGYQVVLEDVLDDEYDLDGVPGYDKDKHKVTRTISLTVNKAKVPAPAIESKPYNGEVQTADVPANDLYTVTKNSGGTNAGEYDVELTLTDPANYMWTDSEAATKTLKFEISPSPVPEVVTPTLNTVTYDSSRTLKDIALPEGWVWADNSVVPTVKNTGYTATLRVDDKNYDYSGVEGYDANAHAVTRIVTLKVNPATPTVTAPTKKDLIYNGQAQPLVNAGSADGGTLYYAVTTGDAAPADGAYTVSIPSEVATGTYTVWYRVKGDDNHVNAGPASVKVTIARVRINVARSPVADVIAYAHALKDSNLTGGEVEPAVEGAFEWASPDTVPTVADSGKTQYAVTFQPKDQKNYNPVTAYITVTVTSADPTVTPPTAISPLFYNGKAQALVEAGSAINGTMKYAVGKTMPAKASDWSENVPTGVESGDYIVWYKVFGNANYSDTDAAMLCVTIYPDQSGIVTPDSLVYNGKPQKLVTAGTVEGGTLQYYVGKKVSEKATDWKTEIPTATDAGEYTVWYRVKGDANHNDSAPASVVAKIAKAPISPTLSIVGWTYGDKAIAPVLKNNPGKGKVTFQYSDAKKGKFSVNVPTQAGNWFVRAEVAATDNYKGITTAPVSFAIAKRTVSIFADNKEGVYGDAIKALTYRLSEKAVGGDDLGITLKTKAKTNSAPGEYPITLEWNGNGNYKAILNDGVYTVSKRPVVIAANAQTIRAGDRIATGVKQATATGLAKGHRLSAVKLTAASTAGNAANDDVIMTTSSITASKAKIANAKGRDVTANYVITYATGKLTIVSVKGPTPSTAPTVRPTATPKPTRTPEPTAQPTATPKPAANPDYTLLTRMTASGSNKLKLTWSKVKDASGYDVYFATCDSKQSYRLLTRTSKRSYIIKGLKSGKSYKAYVMAWQKRNGKRYYIGSASPIVHAIAGDYTSKQCNARSVKLNKSSLTLNTGKSSTLKATVKGVKSGRKLLQHVRLVRYYSSDANIAKVNNNGKVTGVSKGSCFIWAIANNGVRTSVKVKVK